MPGLTWEEFAGADGTVYQVEVGEDRIDLTLESATELANSGREGGSFSLRFRGPAEPILSQGTYPFRAEAFASDIFIVPIGRGEDGARYEAVFF